MPTRLLMVPPEVGAPGRGTTELRIYGVLGSSHVGTEKTTLKKVRFGGAPVLEGEYAATVTPEVVRRTLV